jgi:O-methyltransferase
MSLRVRFSGSRLTTMRPSALDMVLGAVMERHSRPNIHAGWKFNFSLDVIFDDGSHLSGERPTVWFCHKTTVMRLSAVRRVLRYGVATSTTAALKSPDHWGRMMLRSVKALAQTLLGYCGYEIHRRDYFETLGSYFGFDAATIKIIERVRPFTVTPPERIFALKNAVEYVIKNGISGDIVECGVWKGGSMMAAALTLMNLGVKRRLCLFDTFTGLTAPTSVDRDIYGIAQDERAVGKGYVPLEEVKANLQSTGYDEQLITYVKGPVEVTLPANAPATIAILRLDTDWYESTRHELQHLFPRLSGGGVLIIDDYGHFEGARQAVDEFIAANRLPLYLQRVDYSCRICVKPLAL